MALRNLVKSLRHRNFRLFFIGQTLSLTGTWAQTVAMSWLVFDLTGSSFLLGTTFFLTYLPSLILSPLAGPWIDRMDKRRFLLFIQTMAMGEALTLAGLTLSGLIAVWHVMALSLLAGVILAVDMPTRQTFLSEMIDDPKDLPNAIAMQATMYNAARLFGPAVAGLILAKTSAGFCFLVNGLSFIAILIALMMMKISPPKKAKEKRQKTGAALKEGLAYAWRLLPIRNILLLLALGSLTSNSVFVLLPELTANVMKGDASLLGWLTSSMGVGALTGALFLASRKTILTHGYLIGGGTALLGAGLVAMPFALSLPAALGAQFMIGFGLVAHMAGSNTIVQTVTDAGKRGSVMGIYTMVIVGLAPFGSLIAGWMGTHIGLTPTLVGMGGLLFAGGASFLLWVPELHRQVRPIYVRLKILPPPPVE